MSVILAFDQGTTSSRAVAVDGCGRIVAGAQRELTQYYPQPGWVEHDPRELWQTQYETAQEALAAAGLHPQDVAAIGITNQRETTMLWDRATGEPLANAIVWQDRRTADRCAQMRAQDAAEMMVRAKTGLIIDPYFSATKIAWLLDNLGLAERAVRGEIAFGTVDTWLIWNLTGGRRHVTDVSNASRTLLFNIETLTWDDELLELFGIPRGLLPQVLPCTAGFGTCLPELFGAPLPICGVAGDQQAALFGQTAFQAGIAKNTYGTGCFVMLNTGDSIVRSAHGLLSTIAFALGNGRITYALEGSVFNAGTAVQWLRDGLHAVESSGEIEALARTVPDNGGVYFVPAFTGLGAPYWDPYARGTILGITRGTTRAHIARAALEAVAFQTADVVGAMESSFGSGIKELRVDGGGSANSLTMQFQADLLNAAVVRPSVTECTALGAAYLAGLQCGMWSTLAEVAALWREDARFLPAMTNSERGQQLARWREAVQRSRHWAR